MAKAPVFDQTYYSYLEKIAVLDLKACKQTLGYEMDGSEAIVPLLGMPYRVSPLGIVDPQGQRPPLGICIAIFKYLLMCPHQAPTDESFCTYKDFKDAAPLVHYFDQNVQSYLSRTFSGRAQALQTACEQAAGLPFDADLAYTLKYKFQGFPSVPLYLLFNDADEDFPAQCTFLFHRSTETYLDMESLAILGGALTQKLEAIAAGRSE
jgi:hypothetical protein